MLLHNMISSIEVFSDAPASLALMIVCSGLIETGDWQCLMFDGLPLPQSISLFTLQSGGSDQSGGSGEQPGGSGSFSGIS